MSKTKAVKSVAQEYRELTKEVMALEKRIRALAPKVEAYLKGLRLK